MFLAQNCLVLEVVEAVSPLALMLELEAGHHWFPAQHIRLLHCQNFLETKINNQIQKIIHPENYKHKTLLEMNSKINIIVFFPHY